MANTVWTEDKARKKAIQLLRQYPGMESLRRNAKTLSTFYGKQNFQLILQEAEKVCPQRKADEKKASKQLSKKRYNSTTAPKLFVGGVHVNPLWPVPTITDYLLQKYGSAEGIKANETLMKNVFGVLRYGHICKELEERSYRESRTVVSSTVIVGEEAAEPFEGMLKVENRCVHNGETCCRVKFNPSGGEPYDWYVRLIPGLPDNAEYIRCRYLNHNLTIVDTWVIRKQYLQGSKYEFTIVDKKKTKHAFRYTLRDSFGYSMETVDSIDMPLGAIVTCLVKGYNLNAGVNHHLKLRAVEYRQRRTRVNAGGSASKGSVTGEPPRVYPHGKTPQQWFHEVEGYGKHIYGNAGRCSCCGREFGPRKGWRVELKDIFFCQSCKNQIYEPSGRGYLNIIYTPMGGQNK